jgi:hydroxymethylpyrimidine/phosphomethylpyrimidine kinase
MLSNAEIVKAVAEVLSEYKPKIVLDPVIVSTSGHRLLSVEAQEVIKEKLLPISELVTPNIPEMETLTNMSLSSFEEKEKAANYLLSLGAKAVLLKGGHEDGEVKTDILFFRAHEVCSQLIAHSSQLVSESISTKNVHGTGCTLSSAIAAFLALGYSLEDAVREAKRYITEAIRAGADVRIGHGFGPVNHFFNPKPLFKNE